MKFRRERQRGVMVEGLESRVLMSAAHAAVVATRLVYRSRPGNQTAGSKFGFTVAAVDANGNTVTTDNSTVTLTFAGPVGGMLSGTKKVQLHNGTGQFTNLSLNGAGVFTLRITDGALGSPTMNVGVAGLVLTTQPTTGGWQSAGTLTIGDPVQQVTSSGTVTGIFLANANGNVSIEMTGNGTFDTSHVITDVASGGTLTPMFLSAGSVSTSVEDLTLLPVSAWSFSNGTFTVGDTVQQSLTNATNGTSGIWLGTLGSNYAIGVSSGRFTSPGNITDANSKAVLKTSASNVTSTSTVTISQLPALEDFTASAPGAKVNVVASVVGANGTVITSDHSKISLVVAAGTGTGSTLAVVTAVNGVATFRNVSLTKAGVFSLKATSGKQSSLASNAITINPGVPVKLNVVSTFPADTAAKRQSGSLGPIVVNILDSFGNVVRAPSELTLAASTVRGWTASGKLSVNDTLVQTQTNTTTTPTTTTLAKGIFLGTDASGNFLIQVTSGQFNNTNVINDATSGATLTPNNAAAFPSNDSTVTAVLNTTLMTATTPGKVTEAANGTAASVDGVATITLTSAAGTAGPNLQLKPGYYTLIVSDGALIGETFQIHLN